ncbi:hypothetical protein PA598K_01866 [Paenibacillus sp. 598K]|nr:hypothetical protein PA598K_01866 [Paenibacillus sp. 598K]
MYGLVSFFATLQVVLLLLNGGLTTTLRRELSSGPDNFENTLRKYQLLRSIEFVCCIIVFLIILCCYFSAEFIATSWLNIDGLDIRTVTTTLRLMSISIALQLLSSLYSGGLLGLEFQVKANVLQILWSAVKNIGVILILWLIEPEIRLFFLWFVFSDLVYVIALRVYLMKALGHCRDFIWSIKKIKNLVLIWRFSFGILIISCISALNNQLDKIIISKYLDISQLGIYNLAYSLSIVPVTIVSAIAVAIFPRFVNYISNNNDKQLFLIFKESYKILLICSSCISVYISIYSRELLTVWTNDAGISNNAWWAASLLVIGGLFLSLQIIPYNLALAFGNTKINVIFGTINIVVLAPMLLVSVDLYGIEGAAISWMSVMIAVTIIYNYCVYIKKIKSGIANWVICDNILPLVFVAFLAAVSHKLISLFNLGSLLTIVFATLSGIITLFLTLYVFYRNLVKSRFRSVVRSIKLRT